MRDLLNIIEHGSAVSESVPDETPRELLIDPSSQDIARTFKSSPYIQGRWGTIMPMTPIIRGIQTTDGHIYAGCAAQFTHLNLVKAARRAGSEYDYDNRAEFIVTAEGRLSGICWWDSSSPPPPFAPQWENAIARVHKPMMAENIDWYSSEINRRQE